MDLRNVHLGHQFDHYQPYHMRFVPCDPTLGILHQQRCEITFSIRYPEDLEGLVLMTSPYFENIGCFLLEKPPNWFRLSNRDRYAVILDAIFPIFGHLFSRHNCTFHLSHPSVARYLASTEPAAAQIRERLSLNDPRHSFIASPAFGPVQRYRIFPVQIL